MQVDTITKTTTRAQRVPLIALLTAGAVSQVGSALTLVAVPWFVLQTTGSAAKAGLTGAAATLGCSAARSWIGSASDVPVSRGM